MPSDADVVVPLRSHRQQRAALVQKLQHAVPGGVLLIAGAQALAESPHGAALALAVFALVSSVLLLGHVARDVRRNRHLLHRSPQAHARHAEHHGIEWADIFAAAVILAEGFEHRMHGGHHFPRPAILMAAILVVAGVFHGRILHLAEGRHALKITETGLSVGGRPFRHRRLHATWSELASIDVGNRWAVISARSGRVRKLDLKDLDGAEHVRAALEAARERLALSRELSKDPSSGDQRVDDSHPLI
ncbi:MAG: hypothetical protein ACRD1V_00255 [Vicinamibacterales bacterium]